MPQPRTVVAVVAALFAVTASVGLAGVVLDGDAAHGRQIFLKRCAVCHGDDGDGQGKVTFTPAPRDLTDADALKTEGPEELLVSIRDVGSAVGLSKQMPAFGKILDDEELRDVATYVAELSD